MEMSKWNNFQLLHTVYVVFLTLSYSSEGSLPLQCSDIILLKIVLKGHGNEADFLGFCINWFGIGPLHYVLSCSDFGFEFVEIFIIEKQNSSLGVDKIAYRYNFFQTFKRNQW
jgi:hypothetical protein